MAFTRKAGPAQSVALIGQVPNPPQLPEEVLDRFDTLKSWQTAMDGWWADFKDLFQRDLSEIQTQFQSDEASAKTSTDSLLASIAAIQTELADLSSGSGTTLQAQINALAVRLSNLLDALSAHIAETKTHGTTSPIVGTQDAQDLDNKQIGLSQPGYGRFAAIVGLSYIAADKTVTVGASDFMIVVSPFTVDGNLTVAGTLLVL